MVGAFARRAALMRLALRLCAPRCADAPRAPRSCRRAADACRHSREVRAHVRVPPLKLGPVASLLGAAPEDGEM